MKIHIDADVYITKEDIANAIKKIPQKKKVRAIIEILCELSDSEFIDVLKGVNKGGNAVYDWAIKNRDIFDPDYAWVWIPKELKDLEDIKKMISDKIEELDSQ